MTPKKTHLLYAGHEKGELKANVVGAFMKHSKTFYVIRPGYDAQGRRRMTWTQVIHDGVPIWEWKRSAPLNDVIEHFGRLWKDTIGGDRALSGRALKMVKKARVDRFRDGVAGVEAARSLSIDGRADGLDYAG